jgi:hypothetical protein
MKKIIIIILSLIIAVVAFPFALIIIIAKAARYQAQSFYDAASKIAEDW